MIHRSAKTAAILAAFMALNGTAALIVGCGQEKQVQGEKLTDENGRTYYLIKNPDGTETARYENGMRMIIFIIFPACPICFPS